MASTPSEELKSDRPTRYYGRTMMGVAIVMTLSTSPGQTFLVSSFKPEIQGALALSDEQFSRAYLVGTLLAAMPLMLVGKLADRFGTRIVTAVVAVCLALACVAIGFAHSILTPSLAFLALRFFGQGALGTLSGHVPALWYERRLGTVEGLRHTSMSLANAVFPVVAVAMIAALGWERAYAAMGLVVALVLLPICATIFRNSPESIGQHLDNVPPSEAVPSDIAEEEAAHREGDELGDEIADGLESPSSPVPGHVGGGLTGHTLGEAMRSPVYWIMTAAFIANAAFATGIMLFRQDLGDGVGMAPVQSAAGATTFAIVGAVTTLSGGWIADRVAPRGLFIAATVSLGVACALAASISSGVGFHLCFGVLGLTQGLIFAAMGPAYARYFGRAHHGAIRGSAASFMVIGTAVGPWCMGLAMDVAGSYDAALWGFAGLCVPIAVSGLWMKPPRKPPSPPRSLTVS